MKGKNFMTLNGVSANYIILYCFDIFTLFEPTNSTIVNQYAGLCAHYEELIIRYPSQCPQVTTVKFITRKPLSAGTITDLSTDLKKYSKSKYCLL